MRRRRGTRECAGVGGGASHKVALSMTYVGPYTKTTQFHRLFFSSSLFAPPTRLHTELQWRQTFVALERKDVCLCVKASLPQILCFVYFGERKSRSGSKTDIFRSRLPKREQGGASLNNYRERWCAAELVEGLIGINYMFLDMFQCHSLEFKDLFSGPFLLGFPLIFP